MMCTRWTLVMTLISILLHGCYRTDNSDSESADDDDQDEAPHPDFEESVQVEATTSPTTGDIKENCFYNEFEASAKVTVINGDLRMLFTGCFTCNSLDREAYVTKTDDGYDVLFVTPDFGGACGTFAEDIRLYLGPGSVGDRVSAYIPWNNDEGIMMVAETTAEADPVDCESLPPCSAETSCEDDDREGNHPRDCAHLSTCGGAYCLFNAEACMMECSTAECAMGESYPLSPSCG